MIVVYFPCCDSADLLERRLDRKPILEGAG
jgi:hypothetical protein